jgi:ADP-ribose pyrophosphatase YjhB (NUDIX family)
LFKALRSPVAFGVSAVVEDGEGRVILVRHSYQPGWHLPGGGVARGEPPAEAIRRELREEIGLLKCDPPELVGLFTRKLGFVTNVIALYRVRGAEFDFKPNVEIREIARIDPAAPPPDTTAGTRRRLAECAGRAAPVPFW